MANTYQLSQTILLNLHENFGKREEVTSDCYAHTQQQHTPSTTVKVVKLLQII